MSPISRDNDRMKPKAAQPEVKEVRTPLRVFRSTFKGNQTPMTVVMGIVLLGLVAYLAPSGANTEAPDNVAARVYGRDILNRDMDEVMRDMVRRMGKQANLEAMVPYLRAQALRQLVSQRLTEELAERHGIMVTDAEVRAGLEARLRQFPVFLDEKGELRSTSEIKDILRQNETSLSQWEKEIRTALSIQKLQTQVGSRIPVDEAWVAQEHRVRDEKVSFESVTLSPEPAAVPDPGEAKLAEFLKASGERFQMAPRRVIQFVSLDQAAFGDSLKVDDATLKQAFEAKKRDFTELKASHILFKAASDAEYQAATQKALALRAKLVAGQDFNKTAEELSEDPSAKGNKGALGWFKAGMMDKGFFDGAVKTKTGEISEPVRSSFGIHLIKLEDRKEQTLEMVQESLRSQIAQERYATKAKERLEQLRKRTGDRGDLGAAARNLSLKVQTSQPFLSEAGVSIEGLPEAGMIANEAFRMKVGQVSKITRSGDRFLVFRVQEEKPTAVPPLAEIRGKVLAAWKDEEARKALQTKVKAGLASGDLKALGEVKTQEATSLSALGDLGQHPGIRQALLNTPEGKLTPALWTAEGKLWAARITGRTPAPALDFEKRRALVADLQNAGAQKLLVAELQDLDRNGNLRPGFSSLWGRFGGIWMNPKAQKMEDLPGMGDLE